MTEPKEKPEKKYADFTHSFNDPWDDKDVEIICRFAKPTKAQIKQLQDKATKNPTLASRNLLVGTVHPEDKDKLLSALDDYPGVVTSFSAAMIKGVGITAELGN